VKAQAECEKIADVLGGLLILGCLPDSPAAMAGLRYGDVVLEVNGKPTRTLQDFFSARSEEGRSIHLRVFRDGNEVELTLGLQATRRGNLSELKEYFRKRKDPADYS
jgi:S1-C subfamily serine protease